MAITLAEGSSRAIYRKSARMLLVERRFGNQDIDLVILDILNRSKGEQKAAARELGISQATLSYWIQRLGLGDQVNKIRLVWGKPVTEDDLLRLNKSDGSIYFAHKLTGNCTSCHKPFGGLTGPLLFIRLREDGRRVRYLELRDGNNRNHWYSIRVSDIPQKTNL